jgi:putative flippase GtrA
MIILKNKNIEFLEKNRSLEVMGFIKYGLLGFCCALIDLSLFLVLIKILQFQWVFSAPTAFIIATLINYLLSVKFLFESRSKHPVKVELALIFLVAAIGLLLNQFLLWIFIDLNGLWIVYSKVIVIGIVFVWNYSSRRMFIFYLKS